MRRLKFLQIVAETPVQDAGVLTPSDIVNMNAEGRAIASNTLENFASYDIGDDLSPLHKRGTTVIDVMNQVNNNKSNFAKAVKAKQQSQLSE